MSEYFTPLVILEAVSALCSIAYTILLMFEKKTGWIFGIVSSITGIIFFYEKGVYGQSLISIYYAAIGIYGWIYWTKAEERNEHINKWTFKQHIQFISVFAILSLICGYIFESEIKSEHSPYLDGFVTVFGLLASIKEARKILTSWIYWFVINGFSVWLYWSEGMDIWGSTMILYTFLCIPGYISWLRIYRKNKSQATSV